MVAQAELFQEVDKEQVEKTMIFICLAESEHSSITLSAIVSNIQQCKPIEVAIVLVV